MVVYSGRTKCESCGGLLFGGRCPASGCQNPRKILNEMRKDLRQCRKENKAVKAENHRLRGYI